MSKRDERLAAKYAAQGKKSATETAREKSQSRSRVPDNAGDSVLDQLRSFSYADPKPVGRDQASVDRAAAHKRRLPPLGGS